MIKDWQPEPLVPADTYPTDRPSEDDPVVSGIAGPHVTVNGIQCLNLATYNFLGLLGNKSINDIAADTIRKYGVGSCGPRGFYGTMDVHLKLEERIAEFTHTEESIVYSYGFATISSVIPAYSKRNDIIFCDESVNFEIQKGLSGSRSKIVFFKHNDMNHLESLLEEQNKLDKKNPSKAKKTRKFIVAEGMYMSSGDLVPLPKLVEFRNRYRVPIILEESLSFGVLGATGRGTVEHFGLTPDDVDLICVSMSMGMASMGGFCTGKSFVINHQRLSGLGYCFSASLPPLLTTAAIEALNIMENSSDKFQKLRDNAKRMRTLLKGIASLEICGYEYCPVIHLRFKEPGDSRESDQQILDTIASDCQEQGLAVVTAKYLELEEHQLPPPSIRLSMCCEHTEEELTHAASVIKDVVSRNITK